MPPRTRAQGESKQGLIITLVFFILATLGLGVSTYFGFAGQEEKDKAKKKAEDEKKVIEDDRNYYKAQAMVFRGYMGLTDGMDGADTLGTLKEQLDRGSLGKSSKDLADVTKVVKGLGETYGWSGNQPQNTMDGKIKNLTTLTDNLAKQKNNTEVALKKANLELRQKEEELQAARKDFDTKLAALTKKFRDEFDEAEKDRKNLRDEVDKWSAEFKKKNELTEQEKKDLDKTITSKDRDIASLKQLVKRKDDEIDQIKIKNPQAPANMRTDWKIVRMDDRGNHPYINLGSSDHVKPQLTFNIYAVNADGRPYRQPKGTLEVVNVIGPHLSQARITSLRDRNRDPVVEGDVIYNASWNPNLKKHVAIAGIIDLAGDGRDSLREFMRNLERQNIEVDAYEDPNEGTMRGKITYQTDFLILGGDPSRGATGRQGEAEKRILEGRKQMIEEAKKYGVQVKNLSAYLDLIGYPLLHATRQQVPSRSANTDTRSDIVPRLGRDKLVPPTQPKEKPPEDMPNK